MTTSPFRYAWSQKLVHWLTAVVVVTLLPMGLYMVHRYVTTNNDVVTTSIYDIHKLLGFTAILLTLPRIYLRCLYGAPIPDPAGPNWQNAGAKAVHFALYTMLVIVPLLGWIGASAEGTRSMWGGFQLPEIVTKNEEIGWRVLWLHGWAAIALGLFIVLHVTATIHHHVVHKDGVLRRML